MAFNAGLPANSSIIAQGPGEIRENFRALKDDRIVDAGTLGGNAASAFLLKSGGVMTGAAGIIAGTAAAPGLYISGDTNTGVFAPAADTLALSTGGTERLRITSAGRFGLDVTSPDYPLQYNTRFAVDSSGIVRWGNNISSASPANYGLLSWDTGRAMVIAGASCHLDLYANSTSQIMRLTTTGRVLIGTTTDDGANKLQITGNAKITGRIGIGLLAVSPIAAVHVHDSYCALRLDSYESQLQALEFANSGTATWQIGVRPVDANNLYFSPGINTQNGGTLASAAVFMIKTDGKVGVGTITPNTILTVSSAAANGINLAVDKAVSTRSSRLFFSNATPADGFSIFNDNGVLLINAGAEPNATSGGPAMAITKTTRILIGTTTDDGANKLQITGNAKITGNLEATGKTIISAGTAAAPALYFTGDTNTGLFAPAADTLALATAGAERFRINSAGRILIGTTTDDGANLLQVTGNAKVTGNLAATGFTQLGDAATGIKMKLLTGTTPSDSSGVAFVDHGLDVTKIIGATAFVTGPGNSKYPPAYNAPGYKYGCAISSASFVFMLESATSLTSSAITIMVWYKA